MIWVSVMTYNRNNNIEKFSGFLKTSINLPTIDSIQSIRNLKTKILNLCTAKWYRIGKSGLSPLSNCPIPDRGTERQG